MKKSLNYPYNAIEDLIGKSVIPFGSDDDIRGKELTSDQIKGLEAALFTCTEREQEVFYLRYQEDKTLKEIGLSLHLTTERVRQIVAKTLRKLRHPNRFNRIRYGNEAYLEQEAKKEELKRQNELLWEKEQRAKVAAIYLSPRSYNALKRAGKNTVSDLLGMTEKDFTKVYGLGVHSINEILSKLSFFKEQCGEDIAEFSMHPFFPEVDVNEEKEKVSPSPKKEKEKRVMLVKTDGYSISSWIFENYEEGKKEMDKQYSSFKPEELEEEWAEMSYCESHDAILYNNGENVYVWKICEIPN